MTVVSQKDEGLLGDLLEDGVFKLANECQSWRNKSIEDKYSWPEETYVQFVFFVYLFSFLDFRKLMNCLIAVALFNLY